MKPRLLSLVVGLQVAWLLGTAFTAQHHLVSGQVIRLETEPVDPRDLLRGDFVILNYHFSAIPLERFEPPPAGGEAPRPGTPVYIELAPEGEYFRMQRASLERPDVPGGHVVLRGQVTVHGVGRGFGGAGVQVEYGLERFYVREGTGQPQGKLTVDVSVGDDGQGMLKELYLDGRPYAEAMRAQAK